MAATGDRSPLTPPAVTGRVLAFVNTNNGGEPERFTDAAGLHEWAVTSGLIDPAGHVMFTDADAATARELRNALLTLMTAHVGADEVNRQEIETAEHYLSSIAARYPLEPVIGVGDVVLRPAPRGADGIFAAVLAGVVEIDRTGGWMRLKACRNEPCRVAFFDRTRNSSGAYHQPSCASMVSMRAYRERKKREL